MTRVLQLSAIRFGALLFFSLFDFYKWGFRLFDIAAYTVVVFGALVAIRKKSVSAAWACTLVVAGIYASVGLLGGHSLNTVAALFVNCSLFHLLSSEVFRPSRRQVELVLSIHLFTFFIQLLMFYLTGNIINYHTFTDIDPRLESSIFRPAGLFYEPAIYCYAVFILTTLLDPKESRYGVLESVAILSMMLSVSLLGFALAALLTARMLLARRYLVLVFGVAPLLLLDKALIETMFTFVENRLSDLDSDASAGDRYGEFSNLFSDAELFRHLLGRGFGASYEQFGSSGASAAISAVGVVGVFLFAAWFLYRTRGLLVGAMSLVAIMVSAPIFTYGVFPYWIASLVDRGWRRPGVAHLPSSGIEAPALDAQSSGGRT